ncbi:MAG: HAD family hydrolase [Methyloprofundus sp.]|nr:HAD family hydrolase [Methyloprofundus sp.]
MDQTPIYALDFDGVICDSAIETAITGWKVATQLWSDMAGTVPTEAHINQFRQLRPLLETGYESILFMRLLQQGESVETITGHIADFLKELEGDTDALKKLFGQTRDQWIEQARAEWLEMNPLFAGVTDKLQVLNGSPWYIITTKQERFVEEILKVNQIELAPENIFGLDAKLSKEAVLLRLQEKHGDTPLCFVEDRLETLINVQSNIQLKAVNLQLADWGYNTEQDKATAQNKGIPLISLPEFLHD